HQYIARLRTPFLHLDRSHPQSTFFPYTTLFRSGNRVHADVVGAEARGEIAHRRLEARLREPHHVVVRHRAHGAEVRERDDRSRADRKSTRLNSSHQIISYAVFCLKKKKTYKLDI